jgi:hypothetical protein
MPEVALHPPGQEGHEFRDALGKGRGSCCCCCCCCCCQLGGVRRALVRGGPRSLHLHDAKVQGPRLHHQGRVVAGVLHGWGAPGRVQSRATA